MGIDYYAYLSKLNRYNSGLKVLMCFLTLALVLIFDSIEVSVFVFIIMTAITLIYGKTPVKSYVRMLMVPMTFIIISSVAIIFEITKSGQQTYYITLGAASLNQGIKVFFKAMGGISTVYMLAFSTPLTEIIMVMNSVRIPHIIVQIMNLMYRYIFILMDTAVIMNSAAVSRLGNKNIITSYKTFGLIGANLFIIALKKANAYYDALVSRGYEGTLCFSCEPKKIGLVDGTICVIYISFLLLLGVR